MPAMDYQASSLPFSSLGRSLLSLRRDQVHAMDFPHDRPSSRLQELDSFQRHVTAHFAALSSSSSSSSSGEEILSLAWVRKLVNSFLICQEEFRIILFNNRPILSRPPLERFITEFYDRGVKALDVCNAIRDGIEQVRQWQKHVEIVLVALDPCQNPIGEGQIRRANKALTDLALLMLDEKDPASVLAHRNRSFGRSNRSAGKDHRRHLRSLSWSVSRSWSAAKQLQAIGNNINVPRGNEIVATGGLVNPVFTMNMILHFVMWALVAAIPCQDRGFQAHFSIPKSFSWGASIMTMHERIMEEAKKRERKNTAGLLKEIHRIERCARRLLEMTDSGQFPMAEEKEVELRKEVEELGAIFDSVKEGLEPFESQVRDVFHRIVRSRMEDLDYLRQQE